MLISPPGAPKDPAAEPMLVDAPFEEDLDDVDLCIVENPSLDLDTYANNYKGLARAFRLMYLADRCPPLRVDALKMAIYSVKRTYNTSLYLILHRKLALAQNLPNLKIDEEWVNARNNKAALVLERLDMDLKNYKSNSIKESIRRGHDELGHHYFSCGDFSNALKCYSRSRDYCTTLSHVLYMCWNVARVSVYLKNWPHVANAVAKSENALSPVQKGVVICPDLVTKLKILSGLALMVQREYKSAAKTLLDVSIEYCETLELLTPGNIAVYAGICALATFDRNDLRWNVIARPNFKPFLELEPYVRDIIFNFYDAKYDSCLSMMNELKSNFLLDIYFGPHVQPLYLEIRKRALVQYFTPYLSVDMSRMAIAFRRTVSELEDEIMQIILDGKIQARIDSTNKILYAKHADERSVTFEKVFRLGKQYIRQCRLLILRATIVRSQILIKDPFRETKDRMDSRDALVPTNNGNLPAY